MKRRSHPFLVAGAIAAWLCATAAAVDAQQLTSVEANSVISDQQPCVVVTGAVPVGKRVELHRPLRLMEALFLAGGLTDGAGEVVRVVHSSTEMKCAQIPTWDWKPDEQQTQSYSIADLKRDEEKANPYLQAGDIVDVERLPSVGVVGCVADGRWFYIREPLTLTRAVAMAGGAIRKAHKVAILSHNPVSPEWPIAVEWDLDLIKKGKAKDPLLKSGDTVEVFRKGGDMGGVHIFW
jgi:hypothetical protein